MCQGQQPDMKRRAVELGSHAVLQLHTKQKSRKQIRPCDLDHQTFRYNLSSANPPDTEYTVDDMIREMNETIYKCAESSSNNTNPDTHAPLSCERYQQKNGQIY